MCATDQQFFSSKMDDPFNVHWNVYKKRAGYQAMISEYLGKYLTEKYPNKARVEFASILSVGHGECLLIYVHTFHCLRIPGLLRQFYAKASVFMLNLKKK